MILEILLLKNSLALFSPIKAKYIDFCFVYSLYFQTNRLSKRENINHNTVIACGFQEKILVNNNWRNRNMKIVLNW